MLLSIIVPVYNVENYLKTCIDSLLLQNLQNTNYEIIAVNDGSNDNSLAVLKTIESKCNNVHIISQENQGLSGARNTGLNNAKGKYILFVDSDDTILPNTIKGLTDLAEKYELDILEFGAAGVLDNGEVVYEATETTNKKVLSGEEYLKDIAYISSACNKLYRLDFLNTNKLRFLEKVYIEDIEFNTRAVFYCKKIMAINTIIAHFLQRPGSITRSKNFEKNKKMIYDIFTVLDSINNFTETIVTKKSPAYAPLKRRVSSLVATLLLRVLKETKDYSIKKDIVKKLTNNGLYPVKYPAETSDKRKFLLFANTNILFSITTYAICTINKLKDGK